MALADELKTLQELHETGKIEPMNGKESLHLSPRSHFHAAATGQVEP